MFIDEHRDAFGIEPICRVLPDCPLDLSRPCRTAGRPVVNVGARQAGCFAAAGNPAGMAGERPGFRGAKVWRQLNREGIAVARCTVARLMAEMDLTGAVREKPVRTTASNPLTPCPEDRVNRQFHAPRPNALWLSDFT
jgi:putative transposase